MMGHGVRTKDTSRSAYSLGVWLLAAALVALLSCLAYARLALAVDEAGEEQVVAGVADDAMPDGAVEGDGADGAVGSDEAGDEAAGAQAPDGEAAGDELDEDLALTSVDEEPAIEGVEALTAVEDEDALGAAADFYEQQDDNYFYLHPSGDKTGVQDRQAWNDIAIRLGRKSKATTLVFDSGATYYYDGTLNVWNNWTIRADNATLKEVGKNKSLFMFGESVNNANKTVAANVGKYDRCKDITIDGGIFTGIYDSGKNGSLMQFMHGQSITIKNCTIERQGGGHSIEFAGCKDSRIENVRFRGTYNSSDTTNEVIQLDACHNSTNTPAGAPWDKTSCSNITITGCDINVSRQPVGIGTSHGKDSKGKVITASHNKIYIRNNTISAQNYAVALKPNSKDCEVKNNIFYKGTFFKGGDTSGLKASGNTQKTSWASATAQITLTGNNTRTTPPDCTYTGDPKKPGVVCTANGKTLRNGVDVKILSYHDNVEQGQGFVEIVGKGALYKGVASVPFDILKRSDTDIRRLAGGNALQTMQRIVQAGWTPNDVGCPVIIATNAGFKDALSAAGFAGTLGYGAPILLTNGMALSDETRAELQRLQPSEVYIAGGRSVVTADVERAINTVTGVTAKRLAGSNSIETANQIALEGKGSWDTTAVLATNASYKDALSAAPVAYALNMPIFLTNGKELASTTASAIRSCGIKHILVIGGTKAIPNAVMNAAKAAAGKEGTAERVAGANAIATSLAIAEWGLNNNMGTDAMGVATAGGFKDALCGAAFCGRLGCPLVLTLPTKTSALEGLAGLVAGSASNAYIFGGDAVVGYQEENRLDVALR